MSDINCNFKAKSDKPFKPEIMADTELNCKVCKKLGIEWYEVSYNGEDGTWVDKSGFIFHRNPNYDFTINAATLIEVMKEKDYYFDFLQFANTVMRDLTGLWLYPRLLCKRFLEWDWNK